jgi:hypothetical protein
MDREAIRVQQPDGSFKIIFREKSREQQSGPVTAAKQESNGTKDSNDNKKHEKRKREIQDPRYFNPLNPEHIDIFGKDLLNKDLAFSLNSGESIKGKMTGYAQYEILIEFDGKKVILMKQAIAKVEVL